MGKCQKLITKSSKKERIGRECGIYTSKKINGYYYCKGHYDLLKKSTDENNRRENSEEGVKKIIKKDILKPKTLNEILDEQLKKKKDKKKEINNEKVLNDILERLNNLEDRFIEKEFCPEFEIYK